MRQIVVGFSKPKKWNLLSWLIMKAQRADFSHVYVKFYSQSLDRELIYQASGLQVNFVGGKFFYEHHTAVAEFEFEISDEVYKKSITFAIDKAGTPYSIRQLFSILIYMVTGQPQQKDGREAYVCSELVGQMLTENLEIDLQKDLDLVTPKDIYNVLAR